MKNQLIHEYQYTEPEDDDSSNGSYNYSSDNSYDTSSSELTNDTSYSMSDESDWHQMYWNIK